MILNGVWSVCLSAPRSLFIAQSCGTNLLIEFEAGKDVAGGFREERRRTTPSPRVCVCVCIRKKGMIMSQIVFSKEDITGDVFSLFFLSPNFSLSFSVFLSLTFSLFLPLTLVGGRFDLEC